MFVNIAAALSDYQHDTICRENGQILSFSKHAQLYGATTKEVCNGGVACSILKLGSLEKTVTASLFHSGLHSGSPFFVKKTTLQELLPS